MARGPRLWHVSFIFTGRIFAYVQLLGLFPCYRQKPAKLAPYSHQHSSFQVETKNKETLQFLDWPPGDDWWMSSLFRWLTMGNVSSWDGCGPCCLQDRLQRGGAAELPADILIHLPFHTLVWWRHQKWPLRLDQFNSIQFNFIYITSITIQIVCRRFTETQIMAPSKYH